MKLVYIEWVDCSSPADSSWRNAASMENFCQKNELIYDVGFVYHEDKEFIVIVGGYAEEDEKYEGYYHRELKIPKAVIKKIVNLTGHTNGRAKKTPNRTAKNPR
jgi:hypothetical protein